MLWTLLLAIFDLKWVFPTLVRNPLLKWKFKGLDRKNRIVWSMASLCLFWCMWKEHNERIFNEEEPPYQKLKEYFIKSLLERSHTWLELESFSMIALSVYSFLRLFFCICLLMFVL